MSVFGPDPNDMSSAKPSFQKKTRGKAKTQPTEPVLPDMSILEHVAPKPQFRPKRARRR